jgi:hypothetical protein
MRFSPLPPKLDASFTVLCVTAAPAVLAFLWLPAEFAIVVSVGLTVLMVLGLRRAWAIAVVIDGRGVFVTDFFFRYCGHLGGGRRSGVRTA